MHLLVVMVTWVPVPYSYQNGSIAETGLPILRPGKPHGTCWDHQLMIKWSQIFFLLRHLNLYWPWHPSPPPSSENNPKRH